MFTPTQIETKLDAEIQTLLDLLVNHEKTSEEYATIIKRMSELHKLKAEEAQTSLRSIETESKIKPDRLIKPPSLDTALVVAANIFGILWLARFEREDVIKAPQAMKFVMKPR